MSKLLILVFQAPHSISLNFKWVILILDWKIYCTLCARCRWWGKDLLLAYLVHWQLPSLSSVSLPTWCSSGNRDRHTATQMCSLLSLMVVSGIATPPPHAPPHPVQNIVWVCFFFLNKKKGAKARNGGRGDNLIFSYRFLIFLIYYI